MSSVFGNKIRVSIFGESHGTAIGMVLDGVPAGKPIDMEKLQAFLDRRAPGRNRFSTSRKEADRPEFLSGILKGVTTGSPISAIIRNTNTRSGDYSQMADIPRPGHADFTARQKYGGHEDVRGGGHFSGRLTACLCIAGGICLQLLADQGVHVSAKIIEIGGNAEDPFAEIDKAKAEKDSVGGIIRCIAEGVPAGIGSPMFDGVENRIAQCVFGIPAVKGIEFGSGFAGSRMRGSQNNDPFAFVDGEIRTLSNHHGGALGGITSGMPIVFQVAVKPTPSIGREQQSISYSQKENVTMRVEGRHDPCIVPRAVPCVEAACAIALYDMILGIQ
jgi:chorismate synthase